MNGLVMIASCNASGESSGHSIISTTPLRKDPFAPSAKDGVDERIAIKDAEIEQLVQERERCSNELQRIKDILGFSDTPDEYKKRSSYLPDQVLKGLGFRVSGLGSGQATSRTRC